jgi:dihydroorotate dehydrogenase
MGNLTKDRQNPSVALEDKKSWQTKKGNLSGKPTWERSNNLITLTKKLYKNRFTIIGTGGIFSGEDAQHKIDLGADLVQLITGMIFEGPQVIGQINQHLASKNTR